ncbi:bifunctional DNA primase/polymerase [Saccharothrix stipae]
MTRYRAALAAAARGWPVVPLRPHGKVPALRGWDDEATLDRDRIRHWWSRRAYNVGISCGAAELLVVDLDVPHGREAFARRAWQHGEEDPRDTYTVATPSVINGCSSGLIPVCDEGCRPVFQLVESVLSEGVIQRAAASGSDRVGP